ncbi:hypothetical protein J2T21_000635 [Paeniglutamicibacter psychrophenolicus]|nr:hypothetical protein [Paeniglutamicibacter psychrophenolicus]
MAVPDPAVPGHVAPDAMARGISPARRDPAASDLFVPSIPCGVPLSGRARRGRGGPGLFAPAEQGLHCGARLLATITAPVRVLAARG